MLFLAAALAAALLAGGAAVLSLYQAGRRRRLEYAALLAGRVPRGSLRSSVLIEQAVVLGFGILTGVAAGVVSAALVLRNLPEFASPPASPPLVYSPGARCWRPPAGLRSSPCGRRDAGRHGGHPRCASRPAEAGPGMRGDRW